MNLKQDFEFYADLEDHPLGEQNIYRLRFINYHRKNNGHIELIDWPFDPFMLPSGMEQEEAFKVLSYLTDFLEKTLNLKPGSFRSNAELNKVLDIERLGFQKLNFVQDKDIIDLFTVTGRILLFKKSKQYEKYFEWYTEGIKFDEVKDIYNKYGIQFYDLIPLEKKEEENNPELIRKKD